MTFVLTTVLIFNACGDDDVVLPKLSVSVVLDQDDPCSPSCTSPHHEFLLLRLVSGREGDSYCTLFASSAEGTTGKVTMRGAPIKAGERLYLAARVYCPTDLDCPECHAEEEITVTDGGAHTLALAETFGGCPLAFGPPARPPDCP